MLMQSKYIEFLTVSSERVNVSTYHCEFVSDISQMWYSSRALKTSLLQANMG